MKELNTFRQFISEEKDTKVSEDKIEAAIKSTLEKEGGAAGIDPLKKAVKDLDVDTDFDIEKFLKKMSNVEKHKNGDYILTPLKEEEEPRDGVKSAAAKLGMKPSHIKEGTWSYGSENDMIKALEEMNAMMMHSDPRQFKAGIDAMDNALYRIFGSDDFHDYLGAAQDFAAEGDLDRAKNALSDAMGVGDRMIASIHGMDGDLEENDKALDEIIGEEKEEVKEGLFDEIDMMVEKLAVHMSAEETLRDLMGEFEAISGGPKVLHKALKNLMMGAGLMEEKDEE